MKLAVGEVSMQLFKTYRSGKNSLELYSTRKIQAAISSQAAENQTFFARWYTLHEMNPKGHSNI